MAVIMIAVIMCYVWYSHYFMAIAGMEFAMKNNNIVVGSIIIALGIIIGGNYIGIWELNLFFDGWWSLFIIIPSIVGLCKKQWISGVFGLFVGFILLFSANGLLDYALVAPLFLIVLGIVIILPKNHKSALGSNKEYNAMFSSNDGVYEGVLENISTSAIFGGLNLNLKNATVKEDVVIECVCIFGGVEIIAPDNVYIEVKGYPIFGGIDNKTTSTRKTKIHLNCTCVFGGIDIK